MGFLDDLIKDVVAPVREAAQVVNQVKDDAMSTVGEVRESVQGSLTEAQGAVQDTITTAKDAATGVREQAQGFVDDIKNTGSK